MEITTLRTPDTVTAVVGGERVRLTRSSGGRWEHRDLRVLLTETGGALGVHIEAPASSLRSVSMHWSPEGEAPALVLNDHWERTYGDVSWHSMDPGETLPWYFLSSDGTATSGVGVRTGAGAFCSWSSGQRTLTLTMDVSSGGAEVRLGERTLRAAEIVAASSNQGEKPFQFARRFARTMCEAPKMPGRPVYGINDWYFTYGRNSAALILEHTELLAPLASEPANLPFSVIDAGWFQRSPLLPDDPAWGDSLETPNDQFKDMRALAGQIRARGMRPAIWTRPLCGNHADPQNLMLPSIKGRSPKTPVLDPTIPENLERVRNLFRTYRAWGYEMVKFDFTSFDLFGMWGFEMMRSGELTPRGWNFHDSSRTNAEIVLELYGAIREASGDMPIIACNTFSHLSAGLFELNRIGDDTSGNEWERTRRMGVNTLAFRSPHHGAFYAADPDCVGLTTKVPWEKNRQWMDLVARSGTPLFISAQPEATGPDQKAAIREAFALAAHELPTGEPLDWMETPTPRSWLLEGSVRKYDWS